MTKGGKKLAGLYQIDELEIAKPVRWDGKWRILIFDIPENTRISREALRGKLKELDFAQLQKSVWVHAYPCQEELEMLKQFFSFADHHYIFIETNRLDGHEQRLKKSFGLK